MTQQITIPVKDIIIKEDGTKETVITNFTPTLINTNVSEETFAPYTVDKKFLSSINYIPDFQQDKPVFKDATKLLDVLVNNENLDDATLKEINQAYCDTLYKYSAYEKLSYGAKIALLKEFGFDYILDLLLHMWDEDYTELVASYDKGDVSSIPTYDEYVKEKADSRLTKLTTLFNLINVLKGKTLGLELVLNLVDMPEYFYLPYNIVANYKGEWTDDIKNLPLPGGSVSVEAGDTYSLTNGGTINYYIFNGVAWHFCDNYTIYETPREPLTALLDVYGASSSDLQKKLSTFTKHYMLPLIDVTLKFTAKFPEVCAYPSGVYELFKEYHFYDYEDNGIRYQKDMVNKISDEHWYYSNAFEKEPIKVGVSVKGKPFKGKVNLKDSYVTDDKGVKHYLYDSKATLAEAIFGTAKEQIDESGHITDYKGNYLQVPLENYIDIDILTGEQQNPHYENGVFYRDTIIKFYQSLLIKHLHLNKTVEQIETIKVGDFDREFNVEEVYLGKSTSVTALSGKDEFKDIVTIIDEKLANNIDDLLDSGVPQSTITEFVTQYKLLKTSTIKFEQYYAQKAMDTILADYPTLSVLLSDDTLYEFTYSTPIIRNETGDENHYLKFCEAQLDNVYYTGIGDLGILGANDYFIYNGMLMYHGDTLKQIGEDKRWTDVGASHATSDTYYTPAINNGNLYYIYKGNAELIERDVNELNSYEINIVKHPQMTTEGLENTANNDLEQTKIRTFTESWYELDDSWNTIETTKWTAITGYINDFYTAFGICDGRLYKLYKNPWYGYEKEDGSPEPLIVYQIMDNEQGWSYVTGTAYSATYEAYGIKNQRLYRISKEGFTEIKTHLNQRLTGIENVTRNENLFTFNTFDSTATVEPIWVEYEETYEEETYTYSELKKVKINGVEQELTMEDDKYVSENAEIILESMDKINTIRLFMPYYNCTIGLTEDELSSFVLEGTDVIIGWDSSFDCVSRYHHCNSDYVTYGICDGTLYSICNENTDILDETKNWNAVCGFYNDKSPRTFAYAISDGALYELRGSEIVLKDNTQVWKAIHGCTTATNNYILGLTQDGYVYKINAKTLAKIDNANTWTDIFGRYSTSTAVANTCYGYGVKNNKLYQFTKDGVFIVSGFWKENGIGEIVELSDYNIETISVNLPDGRVINGVENIKEIVPANGTIQSDYDIYITYNTRGFNNNERYNIRTELTDLNYIYQHPQDCRADISEEHCVDLFDTHTGLMTGFITKNFKIVGADTVDGNGIATRFLDNNGYIVLPKYDGELRSINIKFSCHFDGNKLYPIVLNEKTGIYYGYNGQYGIFVKHSNGTSESYSLLRAGEFGKDLEGELKFTPLGAHTKVTLYPFNTTYESLSTAFIDMPKYLGGYETDLGNSFIYLADSYIMTSTGKLSLYENGRYFSVNTLNQDLVEYLETDNSQATQKVIEVIKANGEVLELSMDELYTQMISECTSKDLTITTDYSVNKLQSEPYEGTSKATLNYVGSYVLDNEKIVSNISLDGVCDFANTGIASHLNEYNVVSFKLSTDVTTPISIKSGNIVTNQRLFKTEENEAYTNKYLLQSEVSAVGDVACRAVPSGIIYELNSDVPKKVTKTLTFNTDAFEINTDRISDIFEYYFDSYDGTLQFYPQSDYDEETQISTYRDAWATMRIDFNDSGSSTLVNGHAKFKITPNNVNVKFLEIDNKEYNTVEDVAYYSIDTTKRFTSLNTAWVNETSTAVEAKDKLVYSDGQCWNFNDLAYLDLQNLNATEGIVLAVIMDDDASKDQGLIGSVNGGIGLKDNVWTYTSKNGVVNKSAYVVKDNSKIYVKLTPVTDGYTVSVSEDLETWEDLFEKVVLSDTLTLGRGKLGTDILTFNGTIDLAQSYTLKDEERLYSMEQTTDIYLSNDDENFELLETIVTPYAISSIKIGYNFDGVLDCYYAELLKDKELGWVENRELLDNAVKNALQTADPSYEPDKDENVYGLEEYGIYLEGEPKRWDTINVTYTTVDKAFYMKPNTDYLIGMDVIDDHESGKSQISVVGTPTWNGGIVSDFENGHCEVNFSSQQYLVLKVNLNGNDQAICGYIDEEDDTPPCIFVQDNKVKYFDNVETFDLFDVTQDTYYIKLYMSTDFIEYSLDGINFIKTDVERGFSGYTTFGIGTGHINGEIKPFKGSIDFTESYFQSSEKSYLFKYYKKIIPYIIDKGIRHDLALTPLLTVRDYVNFAFGFNGAIDMYESGLCLPDTRYWQANQIKIINKADDTVRDIIIRDSITVDSAYRTESELVKIEPKDLQIYFPEVPKIGSQIVLTYDSWYLFREKNTKYEFKINYIGNKATISYKKTDGVEYTIYITERQNFVVNTGFQFNGILNVKDSTRGGMKMSDYTVWNTYRIVYKKASESEWELWCEFILENNVFIYQRCGYDLKGTHYLPSSWFKLDTVESPFVSFYNSAYIKPVGNLSFTPDGWVSNFSDEAYLAVLMEKILKGYKISFNVCTGEGGNQGVSTFISGYEGYFKSDEPSEIDTYRFRTNYNYIIQYFFDSYGITVGDVNSMSVRKLESTLVKMFTTGDNQVVVRILGYNVGENPYAPTKTDLKTLTIIPYNPNKSEGKTGYYVTTPEQANRVALTYRKDLHPYDYATGEGLDKWYNLKLTKQTVDYFGKKLDVYAVQIPFGYSQSSEQEINYNPDMDYYMGEVIEVKAESNITAYNKIIPYNTLVKRIRAEF